MTSVSPPTYYFNGIYYNSSFYTTTTSGLTTALANTLYLRKTVPDTAIVSETFTAGLLTSGVNPLTSSSVLQLGDPANTGRVIISTINTGNTNALPAISIGSDSGTKTIKINNGTNSVHCSSLDLQSYSINNIVNDTGTVSIGDKQTVGVLNLGVGTVYRTSLINIGTGLSAGLNCRVVIGSASMPVRTSGITQLGHNAAVIASYIKASTVSPKAYLDFFTGIGTTAPTTYDARIEANFGTGDGSNGSALLQYTGSYHDFVNSAATTLLSIKTASITCSSSLIASIGLITSTIDASTGALNIGTSTATSINIGKSGSALTTTLYGLISANTSLATPQILSPAIDSANTSTALSIGNTSGAVSLGATASSTRQINIANGTSQNSNIYIGGSGTGASTLGNIALNSPTSAYSLTTSNVYAGSINAASTGGASFEIGNGAGSGTINLGYTASSTRQINIGSAPSQSSAINIGGTGLTTIGGTLTSTGLLTANGGLTIGGSNNITLGSGTSAPSAGTQLGGITSGSIVTTGGVTSFQVGTITIPSLGVYNIEWVFQLNCTTLPTSGYVQLQYPNTPPQLVFTPSAGPNFPLGYPVTPVILCASGSFIARCTTAGILNLRLFIVGTVDSTSGGTFTATRLA